MSEDKSSSASGGIGLSGAVFVLFLGLKLGGVMPVAGWSWWWVTAPLWGGLAIIIAIALVWLLVATFRNMH